MEIIKEAINEPGLVLTHAQSQLIITNVRRVIMARDITLVGRIAFRFLTNHYSFIHADTHFNFVCHYKGQNFIMFLKTIEYANKSTHSNPIVEKTLEVLTNLCVEALADRLSISSLSRTS